MAEVEAYVPGRASELCPEQNAAALSQNWTDRVALTKVDPAAGEKPRYRAPGERRNPFGLPDVDPLAADVRQFASEARLPGGAGDANAQEWNDKAFAGDASSIEADNDEITAVLSQ